MVSFALLRLLGIVLLVAANAFFVAAEFALVSVRETRVQQMIEAHRTGARAVQRLQQHLDQLLSCVQFGVTLASLGLGWIGEPALARFFEPGFDKLPHALIWSHALAAAIAFLMITYLEVVLGELVPKSIALERADRVALAVAGPMEVFINISRPALVVFSRSARFVLRLLGTRRIREAGVHSPEELKLMVSASRRGGLLLPLEAETIHRTLDLSILTVREIMVPRPDIFSLPADMPLDEALHRVTEEQHSRVPIYDPARGPEHIIGVLYAKELMRWMDLRLAQSRSDRLPTPLPQLTIRNVMRSVLIVPETKPLSDLLVDFKTRRRHLAVVVDEFGSTVGVVTVEDVLEQIVGEIEDEFDIAPPPPPVFGGTMILEGSANLRDLDLQNHLELPRDQGFETLAGFVLSILQRIPKSGDSFVFDHRRYTVLDIDGHRISHVKIEPLAEEKVEQAGD
jgi:CBS domain containing-hemolysin-like protein